MFIDIHAHAYRYHQNFVCAFCSAEELVARYDELGIAMGVVQPIVNPEIYLPQSNEDILDMAAKYPDRLIPFCNIDPRALNNSPYTNFSDLMKYYKDRGCKGIGEVMPNMRMDDPLLQNLFYHAEKAGLSVTIDGAVQIGGDFGVYDEPGLPLLEYTLLSYPELIIFGHGPLFWSEIARLETPGERGFKMNARARTAGKMGEGPIKEEGVVPKLMRKCPNLYCDLSDGTPYHMLSRDVEFGSKFLTEFQDRMFFGTDIVSPTMPVPIIGLLNEWRDKKYITQEVYDKITYKNAKKFLGL